MIVWVMICTGSSRLKVTFWPVIIIIVKAPRTVLPTNNLQEASGVDLEV